MFIRSLRSLFLSVVLFAAPAAVQAAEYVVQQGDTLVSVAQRTGHTPEQIVIMNSGHDWAMSGLSVGTELTYLSRDDLRKARTWCRQRLVELEPGNANATIFAACVEDTRSRRSAHIRYALNEPSGTHFSSVLVFANALRLSRQRVPGPSILELNVRR